ncbi:MAG: GspH/FimT family pseudopilin [Gammaproteobacteria bacterium]|nr:GspH/FimT family pseudopilin [Gammaproteobacteria bacterium]
MNTSSVDGLTLLEILVVLALVGILLTIAIPAYSSFVTYNRMAAEMSDFTETLMLARSEAIKRGETVTVCTSGGSSSSCSDGASWNQGWIVFVDPDDSQSIGPTTTIIRTASSWTGTDTLTGSGGVANAISFSPLGILVGAGTGGGVITLHDAANNVSFRRCVTIGVSGTLTQAEGAQCP